MGHDHAISGCVQPSGKRQRNDTKVQQAQRKWVTLAIVMLQSQDTKTQGRYLAQACQADCPPRAASCLDSQESSSATYHRKRLLGCCRRNWKWQDNPDSSTACEGRLGGSGVHSLHTAAKGGGDHSSRTCCSGVSLSSWSRGKLL